MRDVTAMIFWRAIRQIRCSVVLKLWNKYFKNVLSCSRSMASGMDR